ncbi:transposase family protein [bacterium AH-315-K03]|nr:transposase family protein [bacterium AH-315-K03]
MKKIMSLASRKELLMSVRENYNQASWADKNKVLDGFVTMSGYDRKYAIKLLNSSAEPKPAKTIRPTRTVYDDQVKQALITIWYAANQICSKRLVPFLPELVEALERHGHLNLPEAIRERLLSISHSSVDRLLRSERYRVNQSVTTTKPGSLFKHRIQVRTFADWDDVIPGFIEADLVAHCGGNTSGSFLNTLVLVDIATGWLETIPLIRKSANDVIIGLNVAAELLPFTLLGLDTDNGSEFINHDLLGYCDDHNITFTRSRAYKKNDQAHVEEKNGSVVRRLVGYDRFEGQATWGALARLYKVMRLYVNFFQPSLKLLSKERSCAKVTKKYSPAKTPYQRILLSDHVTVEIKERLTLQYKTLDPVTLLSELGSLQNQLWEHSWNNKKITTPEDHVVEIIPDVKRKEEVQEQSKSDIQSSNGVCKFYHRKEKVDLRKTSRTWRTRKDPFEDVWDEVRLRLEISPEYSPTDIMKWLMEKHPEKFKNNQLRTLQRRISEWRNQQQSQEARKTRSKLSCLIVSDQAHQKSS